MIARRDAAQATLDHFAGQPFQWGRFDCAKMVAFHLRKMGHRIGISKAGPYSNALGAKRALSRLDWSGLSQPLDARFERIAPAAAIVGDILQMPSEGWIEALAVVLGNGRALAYHQHEVAAVVVQPVVSEIIAVWRVVPL